MLSLRPAQECRSVHFELTHCLCVRRSKTTQRCPDRWSKANGWLNGMSVRELILKKAQALGDYLSLVSGGRRVIEIRLGRDLEDDLIRLADMMEINKQHNI